MNWYKKIKLSHRGNIPKAWDLDNMFEDPYRKHRIDPSEDLTTPADEEFGGGLGTRFRGSLMPKDFSAISDGEYALQKNNDLETREHMMNVTPPNTGIEDGVLADPEDPTSRNYRIMDKLFDPKKEPQGVHNMNSGKNVPGPYKSPKSNNVFDYVVKKQKR